MNFRYWFTLRNKHYQILPHFGWTTEVYQWLKDRTWQKGGWAYNFGMSFAWISLSMGFRVSGTFFNIKDETPDFIGTERHCGFSLSKAKPRKAKTLTFKNDWQGEILANLISADIEGYRDFSLKTDSDLNIEKGEIGEVLVALEKGPENMAGVVTAIR